MRAVTLGQQIVGHWHQLTPVPPPNRQPRWPPRNSSLSVKGNDNRLDSRGNGGIKCVAADGDRPIAGTGRTNVVTGQPGQRLWEAAVATVWPSGRRGGPSKTIGWRPP